MPHLYLKTNVDLGSEAKLNVLQAASSAVAEMLGKPESYVMVTLQDGQAMSFAGSTGPTAYVELVSLGLAASACAAMSAALCELIDAELGVPAARVYIEFKSPDRAMFGWDGTTFG